jgi:hypothetical protein
LCRVSANRLFIPTIEYTKTLKTSKQKKTRIKFE